MKSRRGLYALFAVSVLAILSFVWYQAREGGEKDPAEISRKILEMEKWIAENKRISGLLIESMTKLTFGADDSRNYRLPVVIHGRSSYITVCESELEEFSGALALQDMLTRYNATKGEFRSVESSRWKKILVAESEEARDHLRKVELPAIQKRINDLNRETALLEARLDKLVKERRLLLNREQGT